MPIKLPVDFDNFAKKPLMAILYIALLAIGYLYIDLRMTYNKRDKERLENIKTLTFKMDVMDIEMKRQAEQIRRGDSAISYLTATLKVLKDVGKIQ